MGRRHEQRFLQRRHADCQQTPEKMCNITYHRRNANQNYNEISLPLSEWLKSTTQETTGVGEDVEKREPSCTIGGSATANWCSHCGK